MKPLLWTLLKMYDEAEFNQCLLAKKKRSLCFTLGIFNVKGGGEGSKLERCTLCDTINPANVTEKYI